MTQQELEQLDEILQGQPFQVRPRIIEWRKTLEEPTQLRTPAQNNAMHLWFRQVAEICQNQGITFDFIIRHTHQLQVTEHGVKYLWHVLQRALFGTKSTTEIEKKKQIDTMLMHFTDLFAKEGIELPPFP